MFLLDTNVISELRKAKHNGAGKADINVFEWASNVDSSSLYISSITILEIETGILLVERKDKAKGVILREWFNKQVIPTFIDRTLAFDTVAAQHCARLHVPNRRSDRDAMIAATAMAHGMTVVTRNVADFKQTGVALINPWDIFL